MAEGSRRELALILLLVLAQYTFQPLREPAATRSRRVFVSCHAGVGFIAAVFPGVLFYNLP